MAIPVIMPRQGQSVETCIITQWHKSKGENVSEGDLLFSYETDKAAFDEEAGASGILLDIFYEEGDEVPVLENVAVIGSEGEVTAQFRPGGARQLETGHPESVTPTYKEPQIPKEEKMVSIQETEKKRISPLARRISREMGFAIETLTGTGPNGRIIKSDIVKAAKSKSVEKASVSDKIAASAPVEVFEENRDFRTEKLSNMRRIIAAKMQESLQNSAQLTHHLSADARNILKYRSGLKEARKQNASLVDITINDLVCFAVIRALKKHPHMNAHYLGDRIKTFHKVHLGIAVDTERGLMVPALQNADELNLQGLSLKLKSLANECKNGSIQPDLLASTAASFTISNLGAYGIEMFTPVLNLPQTGILGVNTITYRPADLGDGTIGFVPHIGLSLTYDHRAVDGAPASAFLKEIKVQIESIQAE
jgi:pyruvate dehydrogenase E2 component (dihydrolipoamide acetyltransferase)